MLVERHVSNRRVSLNQRLRTIPVMHVPIDNEHLLVPRTLSVSGRDHDVIHQAKSHSPTCERMVPRWTNGGKGVASPIDRMIHGGQDRARGSQGSRPAVFIEHRIEKQNATTAGTHRLE
jgi:hypothetical protein